MIIRVGHWEYWKETMCSGHDRSHYTYEVTAAVYAQDKVSRYSGVDGRGSQDPIPSWAASLPFYMKYENIPE